MPASSIFFRMGGFSTRIFMLSIQIIRRMINSFACYVFMVVGLEKVITFCASLCFLPRLLASRKNLKKHRGYQCTVSYSNKFLFQFFLPIRRSVISRTTAPLIMSSFFSVLKWSEVSFPLWLFFHKPVINLKRDSPIHIPNDAAARRRMMVI